MHQKTFALCAAVALLAVAVACSKSPQSPSAPGAVGGTSPAAAADGSTLKATPPTPGSPIDNAQPETLVLTATKASGKFDSTVPLTYQFEIKNAGGSTVCTSSEVAAGAGTTVSFTPACTMEFDQPHTWRARAVYQGAFGPWSSAAAFRTPNGGYISGSEVFDVLSNGKTVGNPVNAAFVPGVGLKLLGADSRVSYRLPVALEQGEFSVMVTGIDEGSPGDKTKVFSMQEGTGDITGNDYRYTAEKRGINYVTPGAVTFRIINGDAGDDDYINDGVRVAVAFSDERWYFWRGTWGNGYGSLEVREDGPAGRVIYSSHETTNGRAYRPEQHWLYLGSPLGRNGAIDASIPGAIYKNLWVSGRPRPNFPSLLPQR
ncbi:MAG: hypothetical protein ABJC89_12120 [Acidobacteriota bacterium]